MKQISLFEYDDVDILNGNWKAVYNNLKKIYPYLNFKKQSHDNIIGIYADNLPDGCVLQFNEYWLDFDKACLQSVFVKINHEFVPRMHKSIYSYKALFEIIDEYLILLKKEVK